MSRSWRGALAHSALPCARTGADGSVSSSVNQNSRSNRSCSIGVAMKFLKLGKGPRPAGVPIRSPDVSAAQTDAPTEPAELWIRNAQLDAQIKALREILDAERARSAELKAERDRWAAALEATQRHIAHITARAAELEAAPAPELARSH